MALIKCPECGEKVSDQAEVCIHCGYPLKKNMDERGEPEPAHEAESITAAEPDAAGDGPGQVSDEERKNKYETE